jgi:hypothetical protein
VLRNIQKLGLDNQIIAQHAFAIGLLSLFIRAPLAIFAPTDLAVDLKPGIADDIVDCGVGIFP